jgi:hypothetical protein
MENQKNVSTFVENENPTFTENKNSVSEFIPYELALELKELGFDEPCFGEYKELECYDYKGGCGVKITKSIFLSTINGVRNYNQENLISAPLWQQAFRWLKDNYNLRKEYGVFPHHTIIFNHLFDGGKEEQAELEALKKLIEIVKNK